MSRFLRRTALSILILAMVASTAAVAATVEHLGLDQMANRADKIFRGTVLDARPGTVETGGGQLPVVTYTFRVEEAFKGAFDEVKGETIAHIRMLGKVPPVQVDGVTRHSPLPDVPQLKTGSDYLIFSTLPGSAGLSVTLGLGQGSFQILLKGDELQAVNEFNNLGLFKNARTESAAAGGRLPVKGPVSYSVLADQIRAELGR
jgi:hypothetical protein